MRYLLLLSVVLSMSACKAIEQVPTSQPVVVAGDPVATVTTISVGKKSTVTIYRHHLDR